MPHPPPRLPARRKTPELFGFVVAWLEDRQVSDQEIDLVLPTHRNGWLRPQIEEKLRTLDLGQPIQADLHRRVTQSLLLFEAIDSQRFQAPRDWAVLEPWVKRALAYFVRTGDSIPDHFEDGFEDDHREFVSLGNRLGALLDKFDHWRRPV